MAVTTTFVAKKNAPVAPPVRASGYWSGTYTAATVNSATAASTTAAATGGIANQDAVTNMVIAAGVATITLGFVPKKFVITNVTDRVKQEYIEGIAAGSFLETAANGTVTLETDGVAANCTVTTTSTVVTVTFSGGICTDNDAVVWEAFG